MSLLLLAGDDAPAVTPPPATLVRPPLVRPTCGSCPSLMSYDQDLSRIWPEGVPDSIDYLLADCWGIEIAGLPLVPGGSAEHPQKFLSWFFDRYPRDAQEAWLDKNNQNGYTYAFLSAPDSMGPSDRRRIVNPASPEGPPGNDQTIDQLLETCARIKARIKYLAMFLGSKYFQPRDWSAQQWIDYLGPLMDAFIAARVVDEFIPTWEHNLFNLPGQPTIEFFRHVGNRAHAAGLKAGMHFSPDVTAWQRDGEPGQETDRVEDFYRPLKGAIDYLELQTRAGWDAGQLQSRIVDTLKLGPVCPKVRAFELKAEWQYSGMPFNSIHPTEDEVNATGLIAACTYHPAAKVWGSGNGIRNWDGTPIMVRASV